MRKIQKIVLHVSTLLLLLLLNNEGSTQPNWRIPGTQREAVEGHSTNNVRYEKDADPEKVTKKEKKAAELEIKLNNVNTQATAAYYAGDFDKALQLYYDQQKLRDGPNVRSMIDRCKELIANKKAFDLWEDGRSLYKTDLEAALEKFKTAIAARPAAFSQEAFDFVTKLEKYMRDDYPQQKQNILAVAAIRIELDEVITRFQQTSPNIPYQILNKLDILETRVSPGNSYIDLNKGVSDAIAGVYGKSPIVKRKVERGFQAIMVQDWIVARAWFEDALYNDPDNPGLKTFVNMCISAIYLDTKLPKDARGPVQIQLTLDEKKYLNTWISRVRESDKTGNSINAVEGIPGPALENIRRYLGSLDSQDRDVLFFPESFQMDLILYQMQSGPNSKPVQSSQSKTLN